MSSYLRRSFKKYSDNYNNNFDGEDFKKSEKIKKRKYNLNKMSKTQLIRESISEYGSEAVGELVGGWN